MNWIIRRCVRLSGHTYLNEVLLPILEDLEQFNWLISDLEYNTSGSVEALALPVNHDEDYFLLSENEFQRLLAADLQIYWGVILGIPGSFEPAIDENNLPFAEGNPLIWKNGNIQHPNAEIEIVCYDSGYTIVKFRDPYLSGKFGSYFTEAIDLERFKSETLPYY
ncbi:hypothetical protein PQ469_13490 [Mucilaginibacter sp. KACC 22773]|uniref:hypothetical protein n=1 Tax=Mucilaginibacter sp. KACC 22773 TaxID=3025671 RepID=UPI0023651568|nr:hypothetical protein [Mucilaginibacter sp. KACC 22773]WDF81018.1 hypothetical protein PQ469_13490 [Mucilaginibacter sp. KACC 22773]